MGDSWDAMTERERNQFNRHLDKLSERLFARLEYKKSRRK